MDDKLKLGLSVVITLLVLLSVFVWLYISAGEGDYRPIVPLVVLLSVSAFMIPYLKRRWVDVKDGYPTEDERSLDIIRTASARAYTISIWWMVALMFYTGVGVDEFQLPALVSRHIAIAGLLGMIAAFGISYVYTNWGGK